MAEISLMRRYSYLAGLSLCVGALACSSSTSQRDADSQKMQADAGSQMPKPDATVEADMGTQMPEDMGTQMSEDMGTQMRPDMGMVMTNPPRSSASVYWVGHSLISHRDRALPEDQTKNLIELVGDMAQSQGYTYNSFKHTNPGAPVSWNYQAGDTLEQRREILNNGAAYDTLVVTEAVPLDPILDYHKTPFFVRRFYCTLLKQNPNATIYVYETWTNFHAQDEDPFYPAPHVFDFVKQLQIDRPKWYKIADDATNDLEPTPEVYNWTGPGTDPGVCNDRKQVLIVPVGEAIEALINRLKNPQAGDDWSLGGGQTFTMPLFFQNTYLDWPSEWPVPEAQAGSIDPDPIIAGLSRRQPGERIDDIHASQYGIYFVTMVQYATIYRRSPVGLPAANGVSANVARLMQEIAWNVVVNNPRTGVATN